MKDEETGLELDDISSVGQLTASDMGELLAFFEEALPLDIHTFMELLRSTAAHDTVSVETATDGKYPPMTHYAQHEAVRKTAWGRAK